MCLVYNSTGDNLSLNASHDWSGHIGSAPYPLEIGNGQWAAFLHVHGSGTKRGSIAAVVYRGKNKYGQNKDLLFAWSTPWGVRSNSVHTMHLPNKLLLFHLVYLFFLSLH